jgi:hypothetical protein
VLPRARPDNHMISRTGALSTRATFVPDNQLIIRTGAFFLPAAIPAGSLPDGCCRTGGGGLLPDKGGRKKSKKFPGRG